MLTSSSRAFPAESSIISNPSIYLVDIRSGVSADTWTKENIHDPGVYFGFVRSQFYKTWNMHAKSNFGFT